MFFDAFTIGNARRMVDDVMQARGVASSAPANYLVNAYEPYEGLRVGTSNTNQYLMRYAPPAKVFCRCARGWAKASTSSTLSAPWRRCKTMRRTACPRASSAFRPFCTLRCSVCSAWDGAAAPARRQLRDLRRRLEGHADQAIAKDALHASITHWLGIAPERIVETFGAVEHSIPYVGCTHHHLHAPMWSRVLVRDDAHLAPCPTASRASCPSRPTSLRCPRTAWSPGDLAVRHPAGSCGCGCPTPWFEVLGRAGTPPATRAAPPQRRICCPRPERNAMPTNRLDP